MRGNELSTWVCMYVCVCVCMHVCMHVCMYVYIDFTSECMHCIVMFRFKYGCKYVDMYVGRYICR
ncbi:hypothetical protein HanOQP8_Chr02g0042001 [Helianthus annuus]|nr:hypothetical protein HanOQP8_Chr02g0042001 [Helianthus annuus]